MLSQSINYNKSHVSKAFYQTDSYKIIGLDAKEDCIARRIMEDLVKTL